MIINRPHALYYNGELIGIIINPDPYGGMAEICDNLSPCEGAADAVTIPTVGQAPFLAKLKETLVELGVEATIELDEESED